jgi:hypothetical protein
MWFLVLLSFFNALADNDLVLRYRVTVGGFPVSAFDVLLLVLGPIAVMMSRRHAYPTERAHPVLAWIFILFIGAAVGGLIGSVISGIGLRSTITTLRNLISLPITVWLGYCLLLQPRSAERMCYVQVIVGIVTAVFVLLSFGHKAAALRADAGTEVLRDVKYVAVYAGMAAVLVLYATVSGVQMFRLGLAVVVFGLCLLGQCATLARSDWVAVLFAIAVVYFLLPASRRGSKVAAAVLGPPVALACLWVGLFTASAITGQDFNKKMTDRVMSLMPGDTPGVKKKAWDTRLASALVELKWWSESPLFGRGFGIHDVKLPLLTPDQAIGLRHNTWTSTLAETGLIGFSAMALVVGSTFVVGRRMVRDWTDRGSVLVGALGVVTASMFGLLACMTMTFNQVRGAIPLALVCGVVLRARAMQQTALRLQQLEAAGYGAGYDDAEGYGNGDPSAAYLSPDGVY